MFWRGAAWAILPRSSLRAVTPRARGRSLLVALRLAVGLSRSRSPCERRQILLLDAARGRVRLHVAAQCHQKETGLESQTTTTSGGAVVSKRTMVRGVQWAAEGLGLHLVIRGLEVISGESQER
eukprot:5453676-Amphidinium_carterae.1